jgi:hypothetical protein
MKKILVSLVAAATLSFSSFGQAPEGFKYQAVVRDAGNTILNNQAVGMRMTIQQGSIGGTTVYSETFAPTTNAYGLVNLEIGNGTAVSGTFANIDWANGPYFIETAVDVTGGTTYTVMGTSQLMSVPYALYAKTSGNGQGPAGPQGIQGPAGIDGSSGVNGLSAYQVWLGLGNTGTETDFINSLTGPQGAQGIAGVQGPLGAQGIQGIAGTDGAVGSTGPTGATGLTGAQGIQGLAGQDGIDGQDGSDGATGPVGPQGIQGPAGNDGADGATGPQGATGAAGLQGATGASGPQGPAGNDGAVGATGPQGPAGNDGATGPIGGYPVHFIGENYGGGIVFYVYDGGQHGLIAATADQSTGISWYNGTDRYTGSTGDGLGAGAMNTVMIVTTQIADNQTGNFPAKVCADYSVIVGGVTYGDWYLPSKYELNLLFLQKTVVGGFVNTPYWSSTEVNNTSAWFQSFDQGLTANFNKWYNIPRVRAIRAF